MLLEAASRPITSRNAAAQVGTVSANGAAEIDLMISDARNVGYTGLVAAGIIGSTKASKDKEPIEADRPKHALAY